MQGWKASYVSQAPRCDFSSLYYTVQKPQSPEAVSFYHSLCPPDESPTETITVKYLILILQCRSASSFIFNHGLI